MTDLAKLVVDAGVAVKWYVPEEGSDAAAGLLDSAHHLLAPELLLAEFGNVLWKKVQRGVLAPREAEEIVDAFLEACPVTFYASHPLLPSAFKLATNVQCTVYDSFYLAVAVAENCRLVTADDRLVAKLRQAGYEQSVRALAGAGS